MTISELLDAAKRKQGSLGVVADRFEFHQSRLSEWRSGKRKPNAGEILILAELAGLPPLETLAQIEQELDEKNASVWARALGNLRAAGVAATVILTLGSCLMMTPSADVHAQGFESHPFRQNLSKNPVKSKTCGVFCFSFLRSLGDAEKPIKANRFQAANVCSNR
ncbi:transcriptional regulator [Paraburkholderia megapolitana]|uniref:transcriptional regulator n=1 Tax=Paraburkholderia megapolitana TaxID=420953 RepID=UPI0038B8C450